MSHYLFAYALSMNVMLQSNPIISSSHILFSSNKLNLWIKFKKSNALRMSNPKGHNFILLIVVTSSDWVHFLITIQIYKYIYYIESKDIVALSSLDRVLLRTISFAMGPRHEHFFISMDMEGFRFLACNRMWLECVSRSPITNKKGNSVIS